MGALEDLLKSERGLVTIAAFIAITVTFGLDRINADQWMDLLKWMFMSFMGGKTVTSAVSIYTASRTNSGATMQPTSPAQVTTPPNA